MLGLSFKDTEAPEFREDESVDEPPAADDHIHHCSDRWRLRYDVLPHAEKFCESRVLPSGP